MKVCRTSRNTVYECNKFNHCVQREGVFTDLFRLVEHYKFSDLRDELVRDRIITGVRDEDLAEEYIKRGGDRHICRAGTNETTIDWVNQPLKPCKLLP